MTARHRTALVLLSALMLTGCAPQADPASAVETAVGEAAGGTFALSDVEGIEGSAFLVACPYESVASLEERLGAEWSASDRSEDEGAQALAVLEGDEVGTTIELDRGTVDFCSGDSWELLPLDTRLAVSESLQVRVA